MRIRGVSNIGDDGRVEIWLDGLPVSHLRWLAAPEEAIEKSTPLLAAMIESDRWQVQLAWSGLSYIWATDGRAMSASYPIWVGHGDPDYNPGIDLCEFRKKAKEVMGKHLPNLDEALQARYGNAFQPGSSVHLNLTTGIPMLRVEWVVSPVTRLYTLGVTIIACVQHQGGGNLLSVTGFVADALLEILNDPLYDRITLSNGTGLAFCKGETGDSTYQVLTDGAVAGTSIIWSGQLYRQDRVEANCSQCGWRFADRDLYCANCGSQRRRLPPLVPPRRAESQPALEPALSEYLDPLRPTSSGIEECRNCGELVTTYMSICPRCQHALSR